MTDGQGLCLSGGVFCECRALIGGTARGTGNEAQKLGRGFRPNCHGPYCEDRGISAHRVTQKMGPKPGPHFRAQNTPSRGIVSPPNSAGILGTSNAKR